MCATTKYVSETWMSIGTAAREIPESPPITNMETKPSANSIGVAKLSLPSHKVASHEKTLIPVGTAITTDVTIIGTRSQGAMPETNMWCAHTEKPSTRIAISESAISRYPKMGFLAKVEITSETIPKPGSIMM